MTAPIDLTNAPVFALCDILDAIENEIDARAKARDDVVAELRRRFDPAADNILRLRAKDHGTFDLGRHGHWAIKGQRLQTVTWDQSVIRPLYEAQPAEIAGDLFDVKISMREKVYNALPPDDEMLPALRLARTTRIAPTGFKLERDE